jgi:hypothetical protein
MEVIKNDKMVTAYFKDLFYRKKKDAMKTSPPVIVITLDCFINQQDQSSSVFGISSCYYEGERQVLIGLFEMRSTIESAASTLQKHILQIKKNARFSDSFVFIVPVSCPADVCEAFASKVSDIRRALFGLYENRLIGMNIDERVVRSEILKFIETVRTETFDVDPAWRGGNEESYFYAVFKEKDVDEICTRFEKVVTDGPLMIPGKKLVSLCMNRHAYSMWCNTEIDNGA